MRPALFGRRNVCEPAATVLMRARERKRLKQAEGIGGIGVGAASGLKVASPLERGGQESLTSLGGQRVAFEAIASVSSSRAPSEPELVPLLRRRTLALSAPELRLVDRRHGRSSERAPTV